MTPDKAIWLLEQAKYKITDEELEAVEMCIRLLNLRPSSIAYATHRVNHFTQRMKQWEDVATPEGKYNLNLAKANLRRWLATLAERQKKLGEDTGN